MELIFKAHRKVAKLLAKYGTVYRAFDTYEGVDLLKTTRFLGDALDAMDERAEETDLECCLELHMLHAGKVFTGEVLENDQVIWTEAGTYEIEGEALSDE